jgi:hypothetical protein
LLFQQPTKILEPYFLSQPINYLKNLSHVHPRGGETQMTTLRFLITTHLPTCLATTPYSLDHLSSATWDLVRSSSPGENKVYLVQYILGNVIAIRESMEWAHFINPNTLFVKIEFEKAHD